MFALPAFHQAAEQGEIGFLRWSPLVYSEQVPDLLLQTEKVCFGFDRTRSVSREQRPVLIDVETMCHASSPPCCIRRVSAPRECTLPAGGIQRGQSSDIRCRRC